MSVISNHITGIIAKYLPVFQILEDSGISLPVVEYKIKYIKPAFYDEVLTVKTRIESMPSVRIRFVYETFNESGLKLNEAETTLVFVDIKTMKPCTAPDFIVNKIKPYFE